MRVKFMELVHIWIMRTEAIIVLSSITLSSRIIFVSVSFMHPVGIRSLLKSKDLTCKLVLNSQT